ncbi:MAG TPA: lysylphosphatidylglycerol synthase transmembrane domain-containing protein [Anaeromyxobacteraceae bacterium]|nr:lysylphosphatidylglycerol synthase transmembrane domain-containing protein [Anaeromyxobacteraceae bacterium]
MTPRRLLQALAGLAISGVALWLTLRGKDLHGVWEATRTADYGVLVPYVGFLLLIHVLRTARWALLLEPLGPVPLARVNAASAVGFMALVVLPFRLGELARPVLVADGRLRVSSALSTVFVERIVDGLFTGVLLVFALLALPDGTPGVAFFRVAGLAVSAAFAALLGLLVLAARSRALALRIVNAVMGTAAPRLAARAASVLDAFMFGLKQVPSRPKLVAVFLLTAAYWGVNGWGMKVLATGFGIDLSVHAAFTVLGVLVVGVMIPAGPGMVGTFQGAVVAGLSLFLPADTVATGGTAYANVLWAAQMGVQIALGATFLFSRHIQRGRLAAPPSAVEEALRSQPE